MVLDQLGVYELRVVMERFRDALQSHRDRLNQLNVYPVPDGDTGTNMSLTLETVVAEIAASEDDMGAVCDAISHGSLMGARGNSGVILSQILRALAEAIQAVGYVDAQVLAAALKQASKAADEAVSVPVEGTILTVVRDVANAAADKVAAAAEMPLVDLVDFCIKAGQASLERTPELLPQLARANVVDAGGAGFLLFLDALGTAIDSRPLPEPAYVDATTGVGAAVVGTETMTTHHGTTTTADAGVEVGATRYEVMFFLTTTDDRIPEFRQVWGELGDSIVIVGGDGLWNCHIHSNQIGASIEAAIAVGKPFDIRVTDLFEQVEHIETLAEATASGTITVLSAPLEQSELQKTAVIAVSVGSGVTRLFESLGVRAIIAGGQTMNPATEDFLQAISQIRAEEFVLLPNNSNIVAVAKQVDACTESTVRVVPTHSIAEGLAALLVYDATAAAEENHQAMSSAAAEVVTAEVTQAVRSTESELGSIAAGQWLGLDRDGLRVVAKSAVQAATELLDELLSRDHELLTIIYGADATAAQVSQVQSWLGAHYPSVVAEIHEGNQPLYPFYFGLE